MINLALRGITLGSKFLLSIYLVKFLSLEANGEYGIFVATISMLTYVLGLDFYSFNNREILQENSLESGKKIKNYDFKDLKNLKSVFNLWLVGSFLSVVYSIFSISTVGVKIPWKEKMETKWILKGLRIALPFFIATLSYKIIQFADRYMVEFYLGTKQTGIYYFFSNISMLIETFVQTTVVMIYSPKLIASLKKDKPFQIDIFKNFSKEIIIYSVVAVASVCAIIYPLLHVVEKTELFLSISVFFVMVITRFIFNISLIYHFKLYVGKKDRVIMTSTLVAVLFNISLNFILIPLYGLIGGALATLISIFVMMSFKLFYAKKYEH